MDIVFAPAHRLAAAIRERELSAVEVLEAHLGQIERHNGALNAIVTLDADGARARAAAADEATARGESWGPLHGVPVVLKDGHETRGMRTVVGMEAHAGHVPAEDGAVAAKLKAAGAIVLGKTNVPPRLRDVQADNPVFGRTNNPWALDRTPGGSSGGAAAAVAAGLAPFDIGSDLGGSIRFPAHLCGVYGLKPTERTVSLAGHLADPPGMTRNFRIMFSHGPIARDVDDLELALRVIAGPDGRDPEVPPLPLPEPGAVRLDALRIAFAPSFPGSPVAAEISAAVERFAAVAVGRGGAGRAGAAGDRLRRGAPALLGPGRRAVLRHLSAQGGPGAADASRASRTARPARRGDRGLGALLRRLGRPPLPAGDDDRLHPPQDGGAGRGRRRRAAVLEPSRLHLPVQPDRPPGRASCRSASTATACRSGCRWSAGAGRTSGCSRS